MTQCPMCNEQMLLIVDIFDSRKGCRDKLMACYNVEAHDPNLVILVSYLYPKPKGTLNDSESNTGLKS